MRRLARRAAAGAFLLGTALVVVLHGVRRELAPASSRLSEYANGPHGWLMTTAFLVLGGGLLCFGFARPGALERLGKPGTAAAVLAGLGLVASGLFPTGRSAAVEVLHSRASAIATFTLVLLVLLSSASEARRPAARPQDRAGVAWAVSVGLLAVAGPVLHDTRWTGLGQRLLWGALIVWLSRASWPGRDP